MFVSWTVTFVEVGCIYTISINQRIKTIKSLILFWFFDYLWIYSYTGIILSIEMTSCVHFIFNRGQGGSGQSLTDTSMNGTWIDKMRVGKGNKEVFCYQDKVTMERDFHPSLTSNYLVGKVLGKGTTSLVRLGYRREDFNWLIVNYEYLLIPHV